MTKITKRLTQALAAATLSAVSLTGAIAQSSAEPPIHFMRGIGLLTGMIGSCPMMGGMSAYADGRVAFLKAELAITEAQEPVWGTYATIETFPSGLILARCHGQRWRRGDLPPVAWERTA